MQSKICTQCGIEKSLECFGKRSSAKDGLMYRCKSCMAANGRAYLATEEGRQKRNEFQARYYQGHKEEFKNKSHRWQGENKEHLSHYSQKYKSNHPERIKAKSAVYTAMTSGKLIHISECVCAHCSQPANEYHHWSYQEIHWLDVIPMCATCHRRLHRGKLDSTIPIPS